MAKIKGKKNYTIEGNDSYMVDTIEKIEEVHVHNYNNINQGNNIDKDYSKEEEEELDHFFDMGIPKTPGFDFIFGYMFLLTFIGLNYLKLKFSFSNELLFGFLLLSAIGLYTIYRFLKNKLFDCIYIKENEVVRGKASYPYECIRLNDIHVNNGKIDFGFVDDKTRIIWDMKDDAAGLLKHKIEEYHHFYNKKNKQQKEY